MREQQQETALTTRPFTRRRHRRLLEVLVPSDVSLLHVVKELLEAVREVFYTVAPLAHERARLPSPPLAVEARVIVQDRDRPEQFFQRLQRSRSRMDGGEHDVPGVPVVVVFQVLRDGELPRGGVARDVERSSDFCARGGVGVGRYEYLHVAVAVGTRVHVAGVLSEVDWIIAHREEGIGWCTGEHDTLIVNSLNSPMCIREGSIGKGR